MTFLTAGPAAKGESAAVSIDLITRAVQDMKSNAKLSVQANGLHHFAWLLAKPDSAPDISTGFLLAQVRAADVVAKICKISQSYLKAALEVHACPCRPALIFSVLTNNQRDFCSMQAGVLGVLLSRICNGEATVRPAPQSALIACMNMLEVRFRKLLAVLIKGGPSNALRHALPRLGHLLSCRRSPRWRHRTYSSHQRNSLIPRAASGSMQQASQGLNLRMSTSLYGSNGYIIEALCSSTYCSRDAHPGDSSLYMPVTVSFRRSAKFYPTAAEYCVILDIVAKSFKVLASP